MAHTPHSPALHARPRAPLALIAIATILALLIIGALLFGVAYALHTLDQRYPYVADTILITLPLALTLFAVAGLALLALGAYNRWAAYAAAKGDRVIRLTQAEVQVAPWATSLHYELKNDAPQIVEPLALAAPIEVLKPLDDWMRWADEQPHILLAGRTKAGKTHLATAILERRLRAGERVFIVDPHSSGWLHLPTAGGAANPNELKYALVALLAEYTRRMQAREDFKKANNGAELPHDHFGRMTVLIDECNAIAEQMSTVWTTFATHLASGSRKVGIALLCLAQSPNVEDIGFSAKMRNNFASIALDVATVQYLIDRERDKPRKIALRESAHDMDYPAAALIGADVWLLDRSNLSAGKAPTGALSLMWGGWDYTQGRAIVRTDQLTPTIRVETVSQTTKPVSSSESGETSFVVSLTPQEMMKIAAAIARNEKQTVVVKAMPGYRADKHAAFVAKYQELKAQVES